MNKKPTATAMATLTISEISSKPPESGKTIKEGTKKTGIHLANRAAPGCNKSTNEEAVLVPLVARSTASKEPHPAKLLGNDVKLNR